MLLALALACAPRPQPEAPPEVTVQPSDRLVGVIHRDGSKACKEGEGKITWHGLFWEAGFVPLVVDDATIEPFHRKPVVLHGAPSAGPQPDPIPDGYSREHCPIPQMRSDMLEGPDGMRLRRGEPLGLAGFSVQSVEPFEALTVVADGDELVVTLANTLGTELTDVALHVHYEGCYGKPGTRIQTATTPRLAPDDTLEHRVPARIEVDYDGPPRKGGDPRHYRAVSVELRATGDHLLFDFDATLTALGAEPVACPEREPGTKLPRRP